MDFPDDRMYSKSHEWAKQDGELVRAGISEYAGAELGDIVFLDLPELGSELTQGRVMGEIESVKAVAELYAPVSGTVVELNQNLLDDLDIIGEDPYEEGWMILIKPHNIDELENLLDARAYRQMCKEE